MKQITRMAITLLATYILISIAEKYVSNKKTATDLIVGKEYIISFDWDNKDPFEEIEIDTVKITGLKNDYVQWQYKNGIKTSDEIEVFKRIIKKNQ